MGVHDAAIRSAISRARLSAAGWYRVNCPACEGRTAKADKRASMSVSGTTGYFQCWKCAVRGMLSGGEGWEPLEVVEVEEKKGGEWIPEDFDPIGVAADAIARLTGAMTPQEFLRSRGVVDEHVWAEAQLGVCFDGKYKGRVIVPVLDRDQLTWRGFVGRLYQALRSYPTGGATWKPLNYLYPAGMNRGGLLYNEAAVFRDTDEPLLVMEGVFDALPYWPDAVACLGKPTAGQEEILLEATRPICVVLDGDAWEEGRLLAAKLHMQDKQASYLHLPPGEDPGSLDPGSVVYRARLSIKSGINPMSSNLPHPPWDQQETRRA